MDVGEISYKVRQDLGIKDDEIIDIDSVFRKLGVEVKQTEENTEYILEDKGLKFYIKDYTEIRRRFILAQLLGHYVMHMGAEDTKYEVSVFNRENYEAEVIQSNIFAINLLCPKEYFVNKVGDFMEEDNGKYKYNVDLISKHFKITNNACINYMKELGLITRGSVNY